MSKVKIIHEQIRLIIIFFALLTPACNGQEQTNKSRIESSQVIANTQELMLRTAVILAVIQIIFLQ